MFGKRLADERRRLQRSQDDFAQIIGIGRSGYAAVEGDRAPLDVERLVDLGAKAGVDVMYVLSGDRASVAAGYLLDWSLMQGIWMGIHNWASAHKIDVPPEKQMLLLKLLYQKQAISGRVDAQSLEDAVRLVA